MRDFVQQLLDYPTETKAQLRVAAAALTGIIIASGRHPPDPEKAAREAVKFADALLEELAR